MSYVTFYDHNNNLEKPVIAHVFLLVPTMVKLVWKRKGFSESGIIVVTHREKR